MPSVYGYARVSTRDQSLQSQFDQLRAAGCEHIVQDVASGAKATRAGLDSMLGQLRQGDTLVVVSLDRLGRSMPQLVSLISRFAEDGIGFRSLREAIDTTTPAGRLVLHVFAALAEFERDRIRERTSAGLAAAAAQGRIGGRPQKLSEASLKRARELISGQGLSVPEAARVMQVGVSTLYRALGSSTEAPK
jgi:DNA invertase Pin-like site-specific DNA recombinase